MLLGATATVLAPNAAQQAVMLSIYGGLLGVLFLTLSAPDVALSQIGVGTAIVPLVVNARRDSAGCNHRGRRGLRSEIVP